MQLGELLGVTNKAVSKWENGTAKPNTILIPKIAEILGVTVEELFAAKKLEKEKELTDIKQYLSSKKKKYSLFCSAFLSACLILPILLIAFISIIMMFEIPDNVLGPLGAVGFILGFIISLVCYIIYRNNFKEYSVVSSEMITGAFISRLKKSFIFSVTVEFLLVAILSVCSFLIGLQNKRSLAAFMCCCTVFLILNSGVLLCLANVKRLLKIRRRNSKTAKIRFSELSLLGKICYVCMNALLPGVLSFYIHRLFNGYSNNVWTIIQIIITAIFYICVLVVILNRKRK